MTGLSALFEADFDLCVRPGPPCENTQQRGSLCTASRLNVCLYTNDILQLYYFDTCM